MWTLQILQKPRINKMIYEFYNILPSKDCIEQIGISRSFNLGLSKYMTNIANLFDDTKLKLSPIIKTDLKKLKDDDCFLVGVRAKNDLFVIGIHVKTADSADAEPGISTKTSPDAAVEYKSKLITLYNDFQKEIAV